MNALFYLYRRIWTNRIIRALKKPLTYVVVVLFLAYGLSLSSILQLIEMAGANTPQGLTELWTIGIFFLMPGNIIAYSRRKGMLFRQSDAHFKFPAPLHPKLVLLATGSLNLFIDLVTALLITPLGIFFFHANPIRMILYGIFYLLLQEVLEASLMILCYGNESLPDWFFKLLTVVFVMMMGVFVLVGFLMAIRTDLSEGFAVVSRYLSLDVLQCVPLVGWNIALTRLFLLGPTLVNVICSILFVLAVIVLGILAYRSKCEGEYYEDAATFADRYAKMKANKKKGVVSWSDMTGKKRKYGQATVEYKGTGAKAIFYRQLLEYKKNKTFIFGWYTLICLGVGIAAAIFFHFTNTKLSLDLNPQGIPINIGMEVFILPGIIAYMGIIFSSIATKWSQELENPYTFLIPDKALKKLWYATAWEHIKALIDGTLLTLPGAVVIGLSPLQTVFTILLYVCLMANRLYLFMAADAAWGKLLGRVGSQLVKLFLQGVVLGFAALAAVFAGVMGGVEAGFFVFILAAAGLTFLGALLGAQAFDRMEAIE